MTVGFVDALLVIVSCPVADPVAVGLKVSVTFNVWPGVKVAGRVTAEAEKPVPLTETPLTVTAAVPLEVRVTVCVVEPLTTTAPNAMLVALMVSAGVAAFNCRATLCEELPELALTVTDCAVVTAPTVAVNDALLAVAGTVTELGTVTALLLLVSATVTPPVGAVPDKVTVQESDSAPVIEVLPQETALTVGVAAEPVPLRLTDALDALFEIVKVPVVEAALVGSN